MCGRYTLATPNPADVRARFPIGESIEIRRRGVMAFIGRRRQKRAKAARAEQIASATKSR